MAEIPVLPVLIVGAGPEGLTLAIDLAWRGNAEPADPLALIDRLRSIGGLERAARALRPLTV